MTIHIEKTGSVNISVYMKLRAALPVKYWDQQQRGAHSLAMCVWSQEGGELVCVCMGDGLECLHPFELLTSLEIYPYIPYLHINLAICIFDL